MTTQLALARPSAITNAGPSKVANKSPAFLNKLYNMVDDSSTDSLIKWSDNGDSFLVLNQELFAREVLGRWFKHQNFTSFVRQLNMYGFHKVPHLQQGVLRADGETEVVNFENPNFRRSQPDLLCLIQRKKQMPTVNGVGPEFGLPDGDDDSGDFKVTSSAPRTLNGSGTVMDVNGIVTGIASIKRHQAAISSELKSLQQSNQHLWQEAIAARERHKKNEDTINRILKFLAGVFGTTNNTSQKNSSARKSAPVVPVKRARLMIEDGGVSNKSDKGAHTWIVDDTDEELDLPVTMNDSEVDGNSDRFTTIDMHNAADLQSPSISSALGFEGFQDAKSPSQPGLTNISSALLQNPSDFPPSEDTSNTADVSGLPAENLSKMNEAPSAIARSDSQLDFTSDPVLSETLFNFLNNSPPDDIQRLLSSVNDERLTGISRPPESSTSSWPESTSLGETIHSGIPNVNILDQPPYIGYSGEHGNIGQPAPYSSAVIPSDGGTYQAIPYSFNQMQNAVQDASDLNARVNAVDLGISSLMQDLGWDTATFPPVQEIENTDFSEGRTPLQGNVADDHSGEFDFNNFLNVDGGDQLFGEQRSPDIELSATTHSDATTHEAQTADASSPSHSQALSDSTIADNSLVKKRKSEPSSVQLDTQNLRKDIGKKRRKR